MKYVTRFRSAITATVGFAIVLVLWQVIGSAKLLGPTFPPPSSVIASLTVPYRRHLYVRASLATLSTAAWGYGIGQAGGLATALLGHLLPFSRAGLDRLASVIHAIPMIALGPLFMAVLSPAWAGTAIAAIGVFFVSYIAGCTAIESAAPTHRDLFQIFGASPLRRLWLLDVPSALPALVTGLRQAVPVAFLGTILGEWFGSAHGLGLLILSAMENFQIALLWSTVILCCGLSLVIFVLLGYVERIVGRHYR